nr:retrovirus-related Pol polyprotein from transposon TNT 1-94 [Tanacetum cinerariifolium]
MAAGSRDRPLMLATGRYPQWRSRFLRYIDTRPKFDALRKCILSGPYKPTTVLVQAVAVTDDSPAIPKHTTVETPMNMSPENKAHFEAEKEAIHLILTGIGDEIYSTVDACQTAQEIWEAIERLQQEFNELRAERLARNANPLALVAAAQAHQDPYYQTSKSHKSYAPSSIPSILTRSHTTTRYKGKEIAKPITPPSETASEENNDPEQAQRDKDLQKNLALIAKYFKKIYKPTNNNLGTSSNSRNKNVDTTSWYKNDNQFGQFGNQRMVNVAGARENVGSLVVQQSGIQSEKGVPLQAEQYDWLDDTDEEIDEQELEVHYSYIAKIQEDPIVDPGIDFKPLEQVQNDNGYNVFANDLQHSEKSKSISSTCLVETDDRNVIPDSPDICDDDIQNDQNDVESDDESVALANLIANLKLDVDENKRIQNQLKKANTTLAQELKECKTILAETSKTLEESNSFRDSCLVALQNKQTEFEKYKAFNDHTVDYDKLERKLNETLGQLALKDIEIKEDKGKSVEIKFDKPSVVRQPSAQRIPKPSVSGKPAPFSNSLERRYFSKTKSVPKTNVLEGLSKPVTAQTLPQIARQAIVQLILFIVDSGCTKHMTGNLKLLCNFVEKFLGLNHNLFSVGHFCDADLEVAFRKSTCFVRDLQGNDLLTGNRGSDLYTISLQESTSSTLLCLMAKASPTQAWLWHRRLSHLNFDYINLLSNKDVVIGLPKLKYVKDQLCSSCELSKAKRSSFKSKAVQSSKGRLNLLHMDLCGPMRVASINGKKYILASDYDNSDPVPQLQNVSSSADAHVPSQQELDLLFGLFYDEFFTATNIQTTSAPSTPTNVHAEENNDHQAEEEHLPDDEFTNPFYAQAQEVLESSSHNIAFLNGPLKEEVYVAQPDGFVDPDHPEKVYRIRKALYRLKQAPRAWYDELSKFLTTKGFTKGLQIHQSPRGIFINQAKYALEILHKHGMEKGQSIEAEYVALSASYAQVMWMRTQLQDYGLHYKKIPLYCDSQSAIAISCNPVQYSRTKHIHTRRSYALSWKPCQGDSSNLPDYRAIGPPRPFKLGWHNSSIVRRSRTGKSPPPAGAGSENCPPMLNKENYVPWSSRLLCYAKSRPNGKLIYNSIKNGPYVRRMIPKLGDANREVPVNQTFHEQTDDELTEKELKQVKADDQAIHTILLGLPEDIYVAVDSCEIAQEICVSPNQPSSSTYMQQPLPNKNNNNPQPSFNQNYMQQPMPNPEDILDPITAMNMALILIAKAFKLNYSTPTNTNQRISSNPCNRQIAQPSMNMSQDRQMQMVGGNGENQFKQYDGQNVRNQKGYNTVQNVGNQFVQNAVQNLGVQNVENQNGLIVVPWIANQNPNGNSNVVATRAKGNAIGNHSNQIRCYNYRGLARIQLQAEEFDLMVAAVDLDEIEEVNENCILMANLQQASTSGTQTDNAPVYDSDGSAEYTELLEPIPEPHQVQQNGSNVISEVSSMEQDGRIVDHHPSTIEETRAYFESLYNNLAIKVEKVSEQKVTTKGTSVNTQFCKQSFWENHLLLLNQKFYVVTPFSKSKGLPKIDETYTLSKPVTLNSIPTPQESKVMKNDKVIAPGMFRINPFKPSRKERVDNTAKTRRPQSRSNTKNDRVPSASKSSCSKNKEVEVEEHPRNLPPSKNNKHMPSECNNVKLAIRNDKSKVVCAMCKQCLITSNHDVYVLNNVNDMNSRGKKQKAYVSNTENKKKQKPKVMMPKKVGSNERHASPKPSKPRSYLRWSPIRRLFDLKGKIIASSESESQYDCSNGDNACNANPLEPTIKRFPNSTSFLGRYLVFMYKGGLVGFEFSRIRGIRFTLGCPMCVKCVCMLSSLIDALGVELRCNRYILYELTKDHPLEQVIGEPSRPVLTKNQLRSDGDMCMYALTNGSYQDILAYAAHKSFTVFQMDMKIAFLYGTLKEDVYVCQPKGFIDVDHPSHVYKLKKALCTINPTLFIRRFNDDILVVHVFVDDIIFGSTHPRLSQPRNTSGRLKGSFLISEEPLIQVFDADYTGCKDTFKSTFGGAQFLGEKLVIQIYLWYVDSVCSKHMTGNLKLLIDFVWKFMGTVRFGNDHVAAILGFGDLQWGNILITRVYFVEGLGYNLFLVGQFCDSDLEVAFRRDACFVKNLERVNLLKGDRSTNLYTINLHEMASASPICLMARAFSIKSWLWHQRLSHLNFDTINDLAKNDLVAGLPKFKYHKDHLCPSCEQRKSKRASHPPKPVPNSRKPNISFLYVFGALCYPKNDREDIGKLGAKGDIGFFICSKPGLQSITSGHISSGLDLTYAPLTITMQQPSE